MNAMKLPIRVKQRKKRALSRIGRSIVAKCQRLFYRLVESAGYHKRDLLITRVEQARDGLEEAKEQFQVALDKFSAIAHFHGGTLENLYRQLRLELEHSQTKANAVKERINAVEDVADALFNEWEDELDHYVNRSLKSKSRHKLKATQQHYNQLVRAMRRAESKIEPVLCAFSDQVLFLKHNLNAQAIASLQNEMIAVGLDIAVLIRAMEQSINKANTFMNSLNDQKTLPAANS